MDQDPPDPPLPKGFLGVHRRGRQPLADRPSLVTTTLPSSRHDQLIEIARRNRVSVAAVMRCAVLTYLDRKRHPLV